MSEKNRELGIRWFEEIWNQRRAETVHELMGTRAVGHMEGGDVRGPEEFLRARAMFLEALPDLQVEVQAAVADDEQVAIRWRATGTHLGSNLGIPPTGTKVAFRGISWMRIADGRMTEGWDAWNQDALMSQLHAAATAEAELKAT